MGRVYKTGTVWMFMLTAFIIGMGIVIVSISGNAIEEQLLSQTVPLSEVTEAGNGPLQINYPWEVPVCALREASTEEIRRFQDAGYARQLEDLALLPGGTVSVNTREFQVDEEGRLIFKGSGKELSYAVDLKKGIIGFGREAASETDDAVKKENRDDLLVALNDPVHELYRFLPAVNRILGREINGGLDGREETADYRDSFEKMSGMPRQVLYYFDVLTVILQTQEGHIILQYDPEAEQFTSCFFAAK